MAPPPPTGNLGSTCLSFLTGKTDSTLTVLSVGAPRLFGMPADVPALTDNQPKKKRPACIPSDRVAA
ncbi:MAG TPA: hypothetical protein VKD72_26175 [Gemmataceae bacterium]|nr:hypothetical protein [Gemmataceae bacterium]